MDLNELIAKLAQIEEQASLTLAEFPKSLTKERQRMIVALTRYLRTEIKSGGVQSGAGQPEFDPERTVEGPRH